MEERYAQLHTVVEQLDGAYEVEFSDDEGKTDAELALTPEQAVFTDGVAVETERPAHPRRQRWRELGIEPDCHAATMG